MNRWKWTLLLLVAFAIYSSAAICMKLGAGHRFLSVPFIAWYCGALLVLAVYAVLWQMVLKRVSLHVAYMAKSTTIIFTTLIACIFFGEHLTRNNIIGILLMVSGLLLLYFRKANTR